MTKSCQAGSSLCCQPRLAESTECVARAAAIWRSGEATDYLSPVQCTKAVLPPTQQGIDIRCLGGKPRLRWRRRIVWAESECSNDEVPKSQCGVTPIRRLATGVTTH